MADVKYTIDVNTTQAVASVDKLNKSLDKTSKQMKKTDNSAKGMGKGLTLAKAGIAALAVATTAALVGMIKTAASFETMKTTLVAVTGSTKEAAIAFRFIQDLAKQLPGSLEETTQAYTKLTALGIAPTKAAMISFANTASATGKSLDQFVEAVADANTGEFERLKEFGIKARKEGENVAFTFQGATTTVKNSSEEIQGFLQSIGDTTFAGAATKQMDTLLGRYSNFKDTLATISDDIVNNSGLMDLLKDGLSGLTVAIQATVEGAQEFIAFVGKELPAAMSVWADWLGITEAQTKAFADGSSTALGGLKTTFAVLFTDTRHLGVAMVDGLVKGFLELQHVWELFTATMAFGWTESINEVEQTFVEMVNFIIEGMNKLAVIPGFGDFNIELLDIIEDTKTYSEVIADVDAAAKARLKTHQDTINLWHDEITVSQEAAETLKERIKLEREAESTQHDANLKQRQQEQNEAAALQKKNAEAAKELTDANEDLAKQVKSLAEANKTHLRRLNETEKALLKNRAALMEVGVTAEEFAAAMANINEQQLRESRDFADGWTVAMEDYADAATNSAQIAKDVFADTTDAMEDSIMKFVKTGKFGFEELSQAIVDSLLNAQIAKLTSSIFGSNTGSAVGSLFAGFFADGGTIPAGKVGIVGERGPELVTGPASVTPIGGQMSGNITYNINAVDAISFKQLVARDPAYIYAVTEQGRKTLPSGR